MDAISTARLATGHPELARRITNLDTQLQAEDIHIRVTAVIRTVAQQNALWQIGRDPDGNVIGKTVTNAKGTESNHVLGLSADVVPMNIEDGQPDWNLSHPSWKRIIALAATCGLRDGECFGDAPHLELLEVPEVPTAENQQIYVDAGVEAVWRENPIPTFT